MLVPPQYSVDTSAILDGWIRYYPPDVFPIIWENLRELSQNGVLVATEEVKYELRKKSDDVCDWVERNLVFVPIDTQIQIEVGALLTSFRLLAAERKNKSSADVFVIALAKIHSCAVVTGERPAGNPQRKAKIPNVCDALGIKWMSLLDLFRERGWQFK